MSWKEASANVQDRFLQEEDSVKSITKEIDLRVIQIELLELLQENQKLNNLMKNYIIVQMDKEAVKQTYITHELEEIRNISNNLQEEMNLTLQNQSALLNNAKEVFQESFEISINDVERNNKKVIQQLMSNKEQLDKINKNINAAIYGVVSGVLVITIVLFLRFWEVI